MINNIDLHIHSTYSDGVLTPNQIVDTAKENSTSTIAISDHDTIAAYVPDLFIYAKEKGIEIIPAVEISTRFFGVGIHVLGYNIDLTNEALLNTLSLLKNARLDYLINVSKALIKLGYILNTDALKKLPTVTKAHIASDVVTNEKNTNLLLKTFGHIPSKGEFIETIMNEGCPAYVEKFSITPIEASKIIKEAGGIVILAHPVAYVHEDNLSFSQIDNLVKDMHADGIEANYIYIDKNNQIFNESEFWNKYAKQNNLITTIGSDFHNKDGIHPEIGFKNMTFNLSKGEIQTTLKKLVTTGK